VGRARRRRRRLVPPSLSHFRFKLENLEKNGTPFSGSSLQCLISGLPDGIFFKPKIPMLVDFMAMWNLYCHFGTFYGHFFVAMLIYFFTFWFVAPRKI
jgi:hypothetical protein